MSESPIGVILSANYFAPAKPESIALRTGGVVVRVPLYSTGEPQIQTYEELIDTWIDRLVAAFRQLEEEGEKAGA